MDSLEVKLVNMHMKTCVPRRLPPTSSYMHWNNSLLNNNKNTKILNNKINNSNDNNDITQMAFPQSGSSPVWGTNSFTSQFKGSAAKEDRLEIFTP